MLEMEAESESTTPSWISFADLMTGWALLCCCWWA